MSVRAEYEEIEVARSDLDPEYVHKRIADWRSRVEDVFTLVRRWALRQGASVEEQGPAQIREEVMRRHGIGPYSVSSLIVRKGKQIIKVVPKGLWTIGGNGRIDLVTTSGLYALVDFAEPFATPDWKIYGPGRQDGVALSETSFFELF